jgi:hypothetical protein
VGDDCLTAETDYMGAKIADAAKQPDAGADIKLVNHVVQGVLLLVRQFTGADARLLFDCAKVYLDGALQSFHGHGNALADPSELQANPNDELLFLFRLSASEHSPFAIKHANKIEVYQQQSGCLSAHNMLVQGKGPIPHQPGAAASPTRSCSTQQWAVRWRPAVAKSSATLTPAQP